jgi:hypothetical protein
MATVTASVRASVRDSAIETVAGKEGDAMESVTGGVKVTVKASVMTTVRSKVESLDSSQGTRREKQRKRRRRNKFGWTLTLLTQSTCLLCTENGLLKNLDCRLQPKTTQFETSTCTKLLDCTQDTRT